MKLLWQKKTPRQWMLAVSLLFMALIVLPACALFGSAAEPTNTPRPTRTPKAEATTAPVNPTQPPQPAQPTQPAAPTSAPVVPTNTVAPPEQPTLAPTAAPVVPPTQPASSVPSEVEAELQKIGLSTKEGHLGWSSDAPISLTAEGYQGTENQLIGENLTASDFVIKTDITWESQGGLAGCGVLFRAAPNLDKGAQYQFLTIRLSGYPGWDIEMWDLGKWQYTLGNQVQQSKSINQENGGTNTYTLYVKDKAFTVFINGQKIKTLTDSKLTNGVLAFHVFQDSGSTTCTFNNAWVWVLK
jgi:hypothetical protein